MLANTGFGQKTKGKAVVQPQAANYRVDPPYWWVGMQETKLELLVYRPGLPAGDAKVDLPGIEILAQGRPKTPITISSTSWFRRGRQPANSTCFSAKEANAWSSRMNSRHA
jgi:hypothetical protein